MAGVCQAVTPTLRLAQEDELIQSENSASIFNTLSDIPSQLEDADLLLAEAMRLAGSLTAVAVETQRRKHLAYLLADQGQLLGANATASLSQVGTGGRRPRSPPPLGSAPRAQPGRTTAVEGPPLWPWHVPAKSHPVWAQDRPRLETTLRTGLRGHVREGGASEMPAGPHAGRLCSLPPVLGRPLLGWVPGPADLTACPQVVWVPDARALLT